MDFLEENIINNSFVDGSLKESLLDKPEMAPFAFVSSVFFNDGERQASYDKIKKSYDAMRSEDFILIIKCNEVMEIIEDRSLELKGELTEHKKPKEEPFEPSVDQEVNPEDIKFEKHIWGHLKSEERVHMKKIFDYILNFKQ
jgi:hypothetical protein